MSESSTDKYKYKRFTSMTSIIEEKEKACKLSTGINDEFKSDLELDVAKEYSSLISIHELSTHLLSKNRKDIIERKVSHVDEDINDLVKEFDLTLTQFLKTPKRFDFSLSTQQINEVRNILRRGDPYKEYSNMGGYSIHLRDLQTLSNGNWLNDNIINICGELAYQKALEQKLTCHCFNSFFFKKLSSSGYSSVARWTKKVDIFSKDRVIIPINKNNTHWTMSYIDMKKHEIHYCDSMAGSGSTALSILLDYLKDESISKKGVELSTQQWKLIDHRDTIPQQNNCTDCGVFTCMNCILACLQQSFDYSQKDIPLIREFLVYSIIHGCL